MYIVDDKQSLKCMETWNKKNIFILLVVIE